MIKWIDYVLLQMTLSLNSYMSLNTSSLLMDKVNSLVLLTTVDKKNYALILKIFLYYFGKWN